MLRTDIQRPVCCRTKMSKYRNGTESVRTRMYPAFLSLESCPYPHPLALVSKASPHHKTDSITPSCDCAELLSGPRCPRCLFHSLGTTGNFLKTWHVNQPQGSPPVTVYRVGGSRVGGERINFLWAFNCKEVKRISVTVIFHLVSLSCSHGLCLSLCMSSAGSQRILHKEFRPNGSAPIFGLQLCDT